MIVLGRFWENENQDRILSDFGLSKEELKNIVDSGTQILFAWYDEPYEYNGFAFVLFSKDNELYTVEGCHCSCYGLEGQWEPIPTTIDALKYRLEKGTLGTFNDQDYFASSLCEYINLSL
jgi:hypothetical protein